MDGIAQVAALQMSINGTPQRNATEEAVALNEWALIPEVKGCLASWYVSFIVKTIHQDIIWDETCDSLCGGCSEINSLLDFLKEAVLEV